MPHRQVQVDLGVRVRRPPAGLLEPGERAGQVGGVEDAGRRRGHRRPGQHLPRHLEQQRPVPRIAQDLGSGLVADGGDRQERVLGQAGLQAAEDALSDSSSGDVGGEEAHPFGTKAVELADQERHPVTPPHRPGPDLGGVEVGPRRRDPAGPDGTGEQAGVLAVAQAHDVPGAVQAPGQQRGRPGHVLGPDGDQDRAVQPGRQVVRCGRGHRDGEAAGRPLDAQPAGAHGGHGGRVGVADEHIVTVPRQPGGDGSTDGAAAEDNVAHGA